MYLIPSFPFPQAGRFSSSICIGVEVNGDHTDEGPILQELHQAKYRLLQLHLKQDT
jgi:hypothetical protein